MDPNDANPPAGAPAGAVTADHDSSELRRDVTVWGSFMWGYADVGADIYTALGLVVGASMGGAPAAFAFAGLVYLLVGLCYTELASAFPVAGGGQYFTMRGLGDFLGFASGAALLLDYTIDIALFALSSAGYFNFFLEYIHINVPTVVVVLGPIHLQWLWCIETLVIIVFLVALNIVGIKVSSNFNNILGLFAIAGQLVILAFGFLFVWDPKLLTDQFVHAFPTPTQFAFGSSLAIISFVGLESISQVAQETMHPAKIIPRTSIALVLNVLIFAIAFSVLGNGMVRWQDLGAHNGDPIAFLASKMPYIAIIAGPFTAIIGAMIVLISANSGVVSASRLTYSMSQFGMLPMWFNKVSPRFRTPVRTIVVFSGVAIVEALFAFFYPGSAGGAIAILADMYAVGATTGYILVFISLLRLRFLDPYSPRPYAMPINIPIERPQGRVLLPVTGILGVMLVAFMLLLVLLTHPIGRVTGPAWIAAMLAIYMFFRFSTGKPVFGSLSRHWEQVQKDVLLNAGDYDLVEEYEAALAVRDRRLAALKPK